MHQLDSLLGKICKRENPRRFSGSGRWLVQEPVEKRAAGRVWAPAAAAWPCAASMVAGSSDVTPYPQAPLTPVFLVGAPVNLRESRHVSHLEPR